MAVIRSVVMKQIVLLIFIFAMVQSYPDNVLISKSSICKNYWSDSVCSRVSKYCPRVQDIRINCRQSCGLCSNGKQDMNMDKDPSCRDIASSAGCYKYRHNCKNIHMKRQCNKTCGVC